MPKLVNRIGQTYGRLTVLCRAENNARGRPMWACRCTCGNTTNVAASDLHSGATNSCGCLLKERITKHGRAGTREYDAWYSMIDRCTNPSNASFSDYGARGISVCPQWLQSVATFIADMGECPAERSIDRIDNDGPYSPENCRWATRRTQATNRRGSLFLTALGETLPLVEWAERIGLHYNTLHRRILGGWDADRAVTEPSRRGRG